MNLHKIAGITVDMGYKYEKLTKQAAAYRIEGEESPDMTIYLSDGFLQKKQEENPHLSLEDCEYIFTSSVFYSALLNYGGFMLHSSSIVMDGRAYLFSASSGTGKSTHTGLWQKVFGAERARILNDDKPAIRITRDGIFACGTPWSGKTDLNINVQAPIAGICFLERSEQNWIKRVDGGTAVMKLLNQTIRPPQEKEMSLLLSHVDKVLTEVPIFFMGCNISDEAAIMAHREMSK
ncbi:MAG: hypothetical protein J6C82_04490 [Clostridia bacterium]|nr:hypothetical protein [Clostridia bacterium]